MGWSAVCLCVKWDTWYSTWYSYLVCPSRPNLVFSVSKFAIPLYYLAVHSLHHLCLFTLPNYCKLSSLFFLLFWALQPKPLEWSQTQLASQLILVNTLTSLYRYTLATALVIMSKKCGYGAITVYVYFSLCECLMINRRCMIVQMALPTGASKWILRFYVQLGTHVKEYTSTTLRLPIRDQRVSLALYVRCSLHVV